MAFAMDDHHRLANVIRACPHKVCLSYDDHPLVRALYQGLYIHETSWVYSGSTLADKIAREIARQESNYN
jgi:hypothetical protein